MKDEEFYRHVLQMLQRQLGAYGLARFLRLTRSGSGNDTRVREEWQQEVTLDEILASIHLNRRS